MSCPLRKLAELTGYSYQDSLDWEQLQQSPLFQYFMETVEPDMSLEERLLCDMCDQMDDEEDIRLGKVIEQLERKARVMTEKLTNVAKAVEEKMKNVMCLEGTERGGELRQAVEEMNKLSLLSPQIKKDADSALDQTCRHVEAAVTPWVPKNKMSGDVDRGQQSGDCDLEHALAFASIDLVLKPCLRPFIEKVYSHNWALLQDVAGDLPRLRKQDRSEKSEDFSEQCTELSDVRADVGQWSEVIDHLEKVTKTYDLKSCIPRSVEDRINALEEFTKELANACMRYSKLLEEALSARD